MNSCLVPTHFVTDRLHFGCTNACILTVPEPLLHVEEEKLRCLMRGVDIYERFFPDGTGRYLSLEDIQAEIRKRSHLGRELLLALMTLDLA